MRRDGLIVESRHGWIADETGRFIYVSARMLAYIGVTVGQLDRKQNSDEFGWQAVLHPDDVARTRATFLGCLASGEEYLLEHRIRGSDGTYRWFRTVGLPLRDQSGRILLWHGTTIDIDDEKRMHAALRSAQRKLARASQAASLAELSASIAHEVNQPLAAIITNAQVFKRWLSAAPPDLEAALSAADRIVPGCRFGCGGGRAGRGRCSTRVRRCGRWRTSMN